MTANKKRCFVFRDNHRVFAGSVQEMYTSYFTYASISAKLDDAYAHNRNHKTADYSFMAAYQFCLCVFWHQQWRYTVQGVHTQKLKGKKDMFCTCSSYAFPPSACV